MCQWPAHTNVVLYGDNGPMVNLYTNRIINS